ncbi:hypothetical protein [Nostoc sp. FACHB-280]|uniref:hypothetical protein n=1 Tax=Nostoc sp. FACHB-280 TaxID=2692839 RepID=UPI00168B8BF3|nr:hypothetical protein [Nostoc sp. FACHB-280]MBD2494376.1 hypothetical protein [Nostoc sp. FACHB-280]
MQPYKELVLTKNPRIILEGAWGATALGRQRRGRVSRLEATVVGFADLKHVAWRIPQILKSCPLSNM